MAKIVRNIKIMIRHKKGQMKFKNKTTYTISNMFYISQKRKKGRVFLQSKCFVRLITADGKLGC